LRATPPDSKWFMRSLNVINRKSLHNPKADGDGGGGGCGSGYRDY
jgi:hypothetical protein